MLELAAAVRFKVVLGACVGIDANVMVCGYQSASARERNSLDAAAEQCVIGKGDLAGKGRGRRRCELHADVAR